MVLSQVYNIFLFFLFWHMLRLLRHLQKRILVFVCQTQFMPYENIFGGMCGLQYLQERYNCNFMRTI